MDADDYESAMIEFLTQKENLKVVWEIGERFEAVRNKLWLKFWHTLLKKIQAHNAISDGWEIYLPREQELLQNYGHLDLLPRIDMTRLHLKPSIEQNHIGHYIFRILYGIHWSREVTVIPHLKEITKLRQILNDYITNNYWIGWKWTDIYLREKATSVRLVTDDSVEQEMAALFIEFFTRARDLVENANHAIAQAIDRGEIET